MSNINKINNRKFDCEHFKHEAEREQNVLFGSIHR